jgi:putative membrane protein
LQAAAGTRATAAGYFGTGGYALIEVVMSKSWMGLAVAVALACSNSAALAQNKADKSDQKFITEAIQGNLAEVKMGELAQQKGQSDGVKQFGQHLATDHGAANQKAMNVASQIGVAPPTEPNAKQKALYDKLAKLSGPAFDRQFAQEMVKDHKQDIAKFQKEAKKTTPTGTFAKEVLPDLQKHLQEAEKLTRGGSASR